MRTENLQEISAEIAAQSPRIDIAKTARSLSLTTKGTPPVTTLEEKQDALNALRAPLSVMLRTRTDHEQERRAAALGLGRLVLQRDDDVLPIDSVVHVDLEPSEFRMRSPYAIVAPADGAITSRFIP